jgi:hypothetical protein
MHTTDARDEAGSAFVDHRADALVRGMLGFAASVTLLVILMVGLAAL